MRLPAAAGALALVLVATPALAESCANARTQAGMNLCAGRDLAAADQALNATYRALVAKITPVGRSSLRAAEQAWIAYRDRQCAFETMGTADGSAHPMVVALCRTALTRQQTARLAAQLSCEEGDLSCGGQ